MAGLFREKSTAGWWLISQANRLRVERRNSSKKEEIQKKEIAGPHHSDSGVATEKNKSHQEQQQSKPKHSPFQNKTKQNKKKPQTFLTNQTIDQADGELSFFFKKKEKGCK
jgi:hypothetical protein